MSSILRGSFCRSSSAPTPAELPFHRRAYRFSGGSCRPLLFATTEHPTTTQRAAMADAFPPRPLQSPPPTDSSTELLYCASRERPPTSNRPGSPLIARAATPGPSVSVVNAHAWIRGPAVKPVTRTTDAEASRHCLPPRWRPCMLGAPFARASFISRPWVSGLALCEDTPWGCARLRLCRFRGETVGA